MFTFCICFLHSQKEKVIKIQVGEGCIFVLIEFIAVPYLITCVFLIQEYSKFVCYLQIFLTIIVLWWLNTFHDGIVIIRDAHLLFINGHLYTVWVEWIWNGRVKWRVLFIGTQQAQLLPWGKWSLQMTHLHQLYLLDSPCWFVLTKAVSLISRHCLQSSAG